MEEFVLQRLRRVLSQERRNQLKKYLYHIRRRFDWLYLVRYGAFTAEDLGAEILARIGDNFEILMVHSSYDNMLPMYTQTPRDVIQVLLSICGRERTLAMPAFFFGGRNYDVLKYYTNTPVFNKQSTPSQMGMISEVFRRYPGVKRSLHPTHSICAYGPLADELTSRHHLMPTTFGEGTPFGVMASTNTVILGIGVRYFRSLTQIHAVEDLLGERYPVKRRSIKIPITLVDTDQTYLYYLNYYLDRLPRRSGFLRNLLSEQELSEWRYHGVYLFATNARRLTQALYNAALQDGKTIYAV